MTKLELIELINHLINFKINENEEYIKITYFELRVKCNCTEREKNECVELIKNKLENMNYTVYFQGDTYIYENENRKVQEPNELIVAIKGERKNGRENEKTKRRQTRLKRKSN